ncbi:hypothetical protein DXB64_05955 [Bacteroides uniformis]|uniref:Uncharacterized protein n=2 Tax=Bacteroides uniformis TaxID=820 RepID=A0A3E4RTM9_BACUN|nr:hypothetical protein DXD40_03110 [Bacteroides uniformis]RGN81103.1 hypothetical protein DXB40_17885 [Bacteroides sp. 4_1_36]RJU18903.1 hypothetical protein DW012_20470 [Bacteroides sp. AF37-16AC]RJU41451.1 hypothetical protein DW800_17010 [Bacteroides sp. AM32-11AC]RJV15832.1 hypothetical protein DWY74_11300 [Bacteroides sp. AF27-10BH]RJV52309.1 hypothetical protein DWX15_12810 [Bacteroides sp. AF18-33]RJV64834.1 hypothetical protein DWV31_10635 [Bacteroides sp. AF04-22]RJW92950.1 hypothe
MKCSYLRLEPIMLPIFYSYATVFYKDTIFKEQTSLLQKKFHYTINAYKATHTFVYQSSVLVNKIM